ncbi:F0F1 ATP synthase subunit delta [Alkanindiges illinoisensis]|uniref:ATP synthase subunit delta n=1 Tax=Alkanindiges illinoisensis TaxID=197183 RepID=A0A4Y7XC38_9GAMM|nr:F0F1 ATP synthase subunit delta [Alkanindiges illinoisensis]TEU26906.1 F0F1 ATP synthase subunit delta [Alkanindiges illinoisensis]
MAELLTLARPYAKAAFGYASEQGMADNWSTVLQLLSAMVQDEAFSAYLNRPELTPEQQVKIIVDTNTALQDQSVSNFITLLAQNDRLNLLPEIALEFEQLKAQNQNQTDVTIESAFPLTDEQKQLLVDRLSKRFNSSIDATVTVNPALIAGVVIRAGDQVIDDSAQAKLEKMRTRLTA